MTNLERAAVSDIAAHYLLTASAVRDRLSGMPQEMTSLFDSPFGWTVLGEYVAASLCISGTEPFAPTVH